MHKNTIALIAGLVVVGFIVFYKITSSRKEKFTIDDISEGDVMPMFKNVQPKDLVEYYGGIDNLTKVVIEHNIPISYLGDPKEYPKIATFLNMRTVSKE